MATKEVTVCDVFGATKNVKRFRVLITEWVEDGRAPDSQVELLAIYVDLSPRALERCRKFIAKGITAPGKDQG